ncbi:hypothetical protein L211DRAFT_854309 [Terfezia boudieri ATCC MYA-4762]|uniref:Uncharacterized protein n=1 Tax=Terfezia boudieri ATCC MYA-4762 TaxID=1051890 RepID=A0A3N4L9T6_9PEZI|nr:hypothetical protein L211DRAFT_854309 [Terfezia boudieri ATCC MYA-4762]
MTGITIQQRIIWVLRESTQKHWKSRQFELHYCANWKDIHDNDNRLNRPKKQLTGAKANSRQNRSFTQFDSITKAVVWKEAEIEYGVDEEHTSKIDAYLQSIQSRTTSHLVYEAKCHIAKLYEFDQNCSSEYIRKRVSWLLDKDHLTCQREKRATGIFQDGDFFNYTNSSSFNRMLKQWEGLPTTLEQSLLKGIRLGILGHCQVYRKVLRWEEAESYSIGNDKLDEYAKELAEDLTKAEQTHLIPSGYFEEGSPTIPDTEGEENDVPTIGAENNMVEDRQSPARERYDSSWDTEDTGNEAVEYGDEEVKDECEDREDDCGENNDTDLEDEDEDDNNNELEDRKSEDEL